MPAQAFYSLLSIFLSVFLFPFAAFNLLILNTNLLPSIKSFVITTSSMEPSIPKGSVVYTLAKSKYGVGDIITFQQMGNVSHRIVKEEVLGGASYYSTKGDANNISDSTLITSENIYGKVVAVIPLIGQAILFYRTQHEILLGTVLPTLLLVFFLRRMAFITSRE